MTRYLRRSTPATNPVWDPIGNPHSGDCLCDDCGPSEDARKHAEWLAQMADERGRIAKSQARSEALRAFDEAHFPERVAMRDELRGLSYRKAMRLPLTPEQEARHDELLAALRTLKND